MGAPELIGEVAASSASYDLYLKLNVYRRNGVREHLVWRTCEGGIDCFILRQGVYVPMPVAADRILRSKPSSGFGWTGRRCSVAT